MTGEQSGATERGSRLELPGGPYLVVGLARSGVAAIRALRERGERVIGVDAGRPDGLGELEGAEVELHTGEDGVALIERVQTVIKSPGVPMQAPVIARALQSGRGVLGELELGWRLLGNEVIAVTGTNGKTTTVEWIGHIHREAGLEVAVAGNVGAALSGYVGRIDPEVTVVCEVSSFQLEDAQEFAPEAAVLLNVAQDHLDRHGSMQAYVRAKLKVFARQTEQDIAVVPSELGEGLPAGVRIELEQALKGVGARRVRFGNGPDDELSEHDGKLYWRGEELLDTGELSVRGEHNVQNAMAAAGVCLARGIEIEAVRRGLSTFKGVKHRLEEVARRDGVVYVNDSKATNVASTTVALEAFPAGVHLILGGQGKGQEFAPLHGLVERSCEAVYVIGEDAKPIGAALAGVGVPVKECGDLEHAVAAARSAAQPGDVVLLSPACASFDQFKNYEERGEKYRELVLVGARSS
jgi:UDP-N-acetylmuramoylalanine--D-glutamate ligase